MVDKEAAEAAINRGKLLGTITAGDAGFKAGTPEAAAYSQIQSRRQEERQAAQAVIISKQRQRLISRRQRATAEKVLGRVEGVEQVGFETKDPYLIFRGPGGRAITFRKGSEFYVEGRKPEPLKERPETIIAGNVITPEQRQREAATLIAREQKRSIEKTAAKIPRLKDNLTVKQEGPSLTISEAKPSKYFIGAATTERFGKPQVVAVPARGQRASIKSFEDLSSEERISFATASLPTFGVINQLGPPKVKNTQTVDITGLSLRVAAEKLQKTPYRQTDETRFIDFLSLSARQPAPFKPIRQEQRTFLANLLVPKGVIAELGVGTNFYPLSQRTKVLSYRERVEKSIRSGEGIIPFYIREAENINKKDIFQFDTKRAIKSGVAAIPGSFGITTLGLSPVVAGAFSNEFTRKTIKDVGVAASYGTGTVSVGLKDQPVKTLVFTGGAAALSFGTVAGLGALGVSAAAGSALVAGAFATGFGIQKYKENPQNLTTAPGLISTLTEFGTFGFIIKGASKGLSFGSQFLPILGSSSAKYESFSYKAPVFQRETIKTVSKGSTIGDYIYEPEIKFDVSTGRVAPTTYARLLSLKGELKYNPVTYDKAPKRGGRFLYYTDAGKFNIRKQYSQKLKLNLKEEINIDYRVPESAREIVTAHELIHYKTPNLLSNKYTQALQKGKYTYRLDPNEIIAYGLENRVAFKGFKVTTDDLKILFSQSKKIASARTQKDFIGFKYERALVPQKTIGQDAPNVNIGLATIREGVSLKRLVLTGVGKNLQGIYSKTRSLEPLEPVGRSVRLNSADEILASATQRVALEQISRSYRKDVFLKKLPSGDILLRELNPDITSNKVVLSEKVLSYRSEPLTISEKLGGIKRLPRSFFEVGINEGGIESSQLLATDIGRVIFGYGARNTVKGLRTTEVKFVGSALKTTSQVDIAGFQTSMLRIDNKLEKLYKDVPSIERSLNPVQQAGERIIRIEDIFGQPKQIEAVTSRSPLDSLRRNTFVAQSKTLTTQSRRKLPGIFDVLDFNVLAPIGGVPLPVVRLKPTVYAKEPTIGSTGNTFQKPPSFDTIREIGSAFKIKLFTPLSVGGYATKLEPKSSTVNYNVSSYVPVLRTYNRAVSISKSIPLSRSEPISQSRPVSVSKPVSRSVSRPISTTTSISRPITQTVAISRPVTTTTTTTTTTPRILIPKTPRTPRTPVIFDFKPGKMKKKKKKKELFTDTRRFQPSLKASALKIFGPTPKVLTGVGLRPIPYGTKPLRYF